jgi:WD40 repeat protein
VLGAHGGRAVAPSVATVHPRLGAQTGGVESIWSVAFSPDGRVLASACFGGWGPEIHLWDVSSGLLIRSISGAGRRLFGFSGDGRLLAAQSARGGLGIWQVRSGQRIRTFGRRLGRFECAVLTPDGAVIAGANSGSSIFMWDVATGRERGCLRRGTGIVSSIAVSPDGRTLASGGQEGPIELWDLGTNRVTRTLPGRADLGLAFSPNGRMLASRVGFHGIELWDVALGKEAPSLSSEDSQGMAWTPDGKTLVVMRPGEEGGEITRWDVATGRRVASFPVKDTLVLAMALSPDGSLVATGGYAQTLSLWDARSGRAVRTFGGGLETVEGFATSRDGKRLAVLVTDPAVRARGINDSPYSPGNADGKLRVWDLPVRRGPGTIGGGDRAVNAFDLNAGGGRAATGDVDGRIRLWDVAAATEIRVLGRHEVEDAEQFVYVVTYRPDGKSVATYGVDGTIRVWATDGSGQQHARQAGVHQLVFLPARRMLAPRLAAVGGGRLILWDTRSMRRVRVLASAGRDAPFSAASTLDGKTLATGGKGGVIKLWSARTGRERRTLRGHRGTVWFLSFSPDGRMLASSSKDGTIRLWDVATGRTTAALPHNHYLGRIDFIGAPQLLLGADEGDSVRMWAVAKGAARDLCSLYSFTDGTWAVIDPRGYYDASNGGDNPNLHWVVGSRPFPLARFKARFYRPGLLSRLIGFSRPAAPRASRRAQGGSTRSRGEHGDNRGAGTGDDAGSGHAPVGDRGAVTHSRSRREGGR